jgi:predicted outer membrane repeat protein
LECLEARCVPSTVYVTSPLDNGGRGTLRYEIAHAANGDTIEMSPTLTAPIVLSQGELLLKKNLTIEGQASQPETISGNSSSRVFEVAGNHKVTLTYLNLVDGNGLANPTDTSTYAHSGGAILSFGTLAVNNATLSNNSAQYGGGILNEGGTVTVNSSTLSGNSAVVHSPTMSGDGGGIWSIGSLTVTNSTLSGNSANHQGGGIYNRGSLTVSSSTLSDNSAYQGGGISNQYSYATATISGSTLSGNQASSEGGPSSEGGGIYNSGTATVSGCTLTGNSAQYGGAIYNGSASASTMTVLDCVFSSNSPDNIFGPYTDGGGNTF